MWRRSRESLESGRSFSDEFLKDLIGVSVMLKIGTACGCPDNDRKFQ